MLFRLLHLAIISAFSLVYFSPCLFNSRSASDRLNKLTHCSPEQARIKSVIAKMPEWRANEFCSENDSVKILNGTFLGNSQRNYYGDSLGAHLDVIWKTFIGKGQTICVKDEVETWMGAGWTGQPLMVEEKGIPYIIQGCYDHRLKKINALNGDTVWTYPFDDIIKGTGTLYKDRQRNDLIVMQGSRIGFEQKSWAKEIFSYRAVSFFSGKEVWRMNVKRGASYSRDVDGSAWVINDTAYIGLENGYFTAFDPKQSNAEVVKDSFRAKIIAEEKLFCDEDKKLHGGELVTESSPCRIGNHLYVTSGSGHVYGYNLDTKKIDWDFYIGSDLDGSAVVTNDKCLIITIEKQFIKGRGGVMKIDPSKNPEDCVLWYFPTGNKKFADWNGGIIGSAALSHANRSFSFADATKQLCAVQAIDGFLYVIDHRSIEKDSLVYGPDSLHQYPKPRLVFKEKTGSSISTPLIIGNRLLSTTYNGLKIFEFNQQLNFTEIASFKGFFEATPFVHRGRVYVASRNGFLYCFGKPDSGFDPSTSSGLSHR